MPALSILWFALIFHLAVGWSLQEGHFWKGNDSFFLGAGQLGLAAHWYCDGLSKPLTKYMDEKVEFIQPGHANIHGIGKMGCYI